METYSKQSKFIKDDDRKRYVVFFGGLLVVVLLNVADIIYHKSWNLDFSDLELYWQEFRVTLVGFDTGLYFHLDKHIPGASGLPAIPIFPWGRIIGNLLCPGFWPWRIAKWYTFVLLVALCAFTCYLGMRLIQKHIDAPIRHGCLASGFLLIYMMPFYWRDMIIFFNLGGVICFLLILMAFLVEKHPYVSAFLLAVSMIKPQNALPFVIILLLEKRWRMVILAAGIDIAAWMTCAFWTGVSPFQQVIYILERSTEEEPYYFWFGLLDPLRNIGVSSNFAMAASMLVSIGILIVSYFAIKNHFEMQENTIAIYSVAAVISTVWMYKSKSDFVIVIMVSMWSIGYFFRQCVGTRRRNGISVLLCLVTLWLLNVLSFTEPIRVLVGYSFTTGMTIDAWGRVVALIMIIIMEYGLKQGTTAELRGN